MVERKVKVENKNGMHLRVANALVKAAGRWKSVVMIGRDGDMVNAKSMLGVAGLGAEYGAELIINIEGEDEQKAIDSMVDQFKNKFYLDEQNG